MAPTIEYWRATTGTYHPAPPGIEVMTDNTAWHRPRGDGKMDPAPFPATFRGDVHDALTWINATPAGAVVLTELENNGNDTGISPTYGGNVASMNHAANSMKVVAAELVEGHRPGDGTRAAAMATFSSHWSTSAALAGIINSTPRWNLDEVPGLGSSWKAKAQKARDWVNQWLLKVDYRFGRVGDTNEGYDQDQTWFGGPWGVEPNDLGITPEIVYTWLHEGTLPPPFNDGPANEQIKLATIAALYDQSANGGGCHCGVRWNHDPASPLNQLRPPAIGLAHELIHAYFGVQGMQPGSEVPGHWSCVLFEYRCVGLGPWDGATPSENALRSEWWVNTAGLIPLVDTLNRKAPAKRIMYN